MLHTVEVGMCARMWTVCIERGNCPKVRYLAKQKAARLLAHSSFICFRVCAQSGYMRKLQKGKPQIPQIPTRPGMHRAWEIVNLRKDRRVDGRVRKLLPEFERKTVVC